MIQIDRPNPSLSAEWDVFVSTRPNATTYHLSAWAHVAERAYRLRVRLLVARRAPRARVAGVLPLVWIPRPFGRYVTTGLFGSYGPVLAEDDDDARELLDAAKRITDADAARFLHVKSFGDAPTPAGFTRLDLWETALLSLEGGADRVWGRFKSSIRAAIRQGMKNGLELRVGQGQLDAFYEVLAENMHRKGSPIYGRRFMRELCAALGDRVDVVTLWSGDEPISGALTIEHAGVVYVPFASSRASWFRARPNNLLYWRIIERACAAGCRALDFGTSMRGTSNLAFKLHWGAIARPAPSFVYPRASEAPPIVPVSPAARAGVALLKILPRPIADAVGPQIARRIA